MSEIIRAIIGLILAALRFLTIRIVMLAADRPSQWMAWKRRRNAVPLRDFANHPAEAWAAP